MSTTFDQHYGTYVLKPMTLEEAKARSAEAKKWRRTKDMRRWYRNLLHAIFCAIWSYKNRGWTTSPRHKKKAMEREFERYLTNRRRKRS